jgi:hypothetical protein
MAGANRDTLNAIKTTFALDSAKVTSGPPKVYITWSAG